MSICLVRWRCWLMQFRAFSDLLGFAVSIDGFATAYRLRRLMLQSHSRTPFLLVFEAAFGFLEVHAGVHVKKMFEIIGYSVSVGEALFFGNVSTE